MGSSVDIMLAVTVLAVVVTVFVIRAGRAEGDRRDRVIASFAGLRLTEDALIEGHGATMRRHPLAGLRARVESPTAPRAVVLSVHGPQTAILKAVSVHQYPRAKGEARAFAARLNVAVRLAETSPVPAQILPVAGGAA